MAPLSLSASRDIPAPVETVFDVAIALPLPTLFARRYAAIPAIKDVRGQEGEWGPVGKTRTIVLSDGGSMQERQTSYQRPEQFGYRTEQFTGALSPIAAHIDGRWTFEPIGTGTRVTWSWLIEPKGRLGRLALPVFARMWPGYARQALETLSHEIVGRPPTGHR